MAAGFVVGWGAGGGSGGVIGGDGFPPPAGRAEGHAGLGAWLAVGAETVGKFVAVISGNVTAAADVTAGCTTDNDGLGGPEAVAVAAALDVNGLLRTTTPPMATTPRTRAAAIHTTGRAPRGRTLALVCPHVAIVCGIGAGGDPVVGVADLNSPEGGNMAVEIPAVLSVPKILSTDTRAFLEPKSLSAMASSLTEANRRSRSFSKHVAMTRSRPAGTSGRTRRTGIAGAIAILMTSSVTASAWNGT